MSYYLLEPEVPGELGERVELDHPPEGLRVLKLHFEFAWGCQGDDLATSHPVFIVSERVGAVLVQERLTGFRLAEMEQTVEEQVYELDPTFTVQPFAWLQLTGEPGVDDFALDRVDLVVSDRALAVLREHAQLSLCDIAPWTSGASAL